MRTYAILLAAGAAAIGLCGCGGQTAREPSASPAALRTAPAPAPLSTAPAPCAVVIGRTLHAVAARIEARAALHRRTAGPTPALVGALTRPVPRACGATAGGTVADTVRTIGRRLVRAEATGLAARRALALVARDPGIVRAVRHRDAGALRTAVVRFFRIHRLHIVRVRATTAGGRLVGDVGGPFVLAPLSGTVHGARGRTIGRVTLSVQDDAGFIKLMRRFTGVGVVLRTSAGVVPGSARAPAAIPARGVVTVGGRHDATATFATRAFPARRLDVAVLVPLGTVA